MSSPARASTSPYHLRANRGSKSPYSRTPPRTRNPVRNRSALIPIDVAGDEQPSQLLAPASVEPAVDEDPRQESWKELKRRQRSFKNLSTYTKEEGLQEVKYPCNNNGKPVAAKLFWKVPYLREFPALRCFHDEPCNTFKLGGDSIYDGHFVTACAKTENCGFWISITEIALNLTNELKMHIYPERKPNTGARANGASPTESPQSSATEGSQPATPSKRIASLKFPKTPRPKTSRTSEPDTPLPSPLSTSQTSLVSPSEINGSRSGSSHVNPAAKSLAGPGSPDPFTLSPFNSILPRESEDNEENTPTGPVVLKLALGDSIGFDQLLETFRRCPACRSLYAGKHGDKHRRECCLEMSAARNESYSSASDAIFDLASLAGIPIAGFNRFYKLCTHCQTVQPMKQYPRHVCDLTNEKGALTADACEMILG